ncbi:MULTISPECIES: bifunctional nicotinamidase/pyrazinamidase [Nannocystis]|uniref:nicotinamidase n=1 Tax=Nannocystis radixulma TaxID=2995305 RepID=A0ABT5AZ66_9BACT|nr:MULTISPECIES: bifunctional nicotinamidase/pyrazinamidase [Nannocystis]MCY1054369.1 bifunctional nicotinamidase/pyrazinamidase [Nannocystis sp. SCPEA4]MDC0666730.1 bifunctional nicotinamidase/pyrazinamidase [Nannocystis radixulma]
MRALILVDIQNDFLPGGALAVPEGDRVIAVANALMPRFPLVVATQDWHPPDHGSFADNHPGRAPGEVITLAGLQQVLWPTHCVQGTRGAEFAGALAREPVAQIFVKGVDPEVDSYSGFFDNGRRRSTGLGEYLQAHGVREAVVLGLATDYCVKFTALDALSLGLQTTLVEDGSRGVELQPGDVARALAEVRAAGGAVRRSADLLD